MRRASIQSQNPSGIASSGLVGFGRAVLLTVGLVLSPAASALDWGPFSLTGFFKAETVLGSNRCIDCQRYPDENRHRVWADELVPGQPYKNAGNTVTLFQPWLTAKADLGGGFKVAGMLSQRYRNGEADVPGFLFERNVAISHEEYGRLAVGAMVARAWGLADYPYGTYLGVAHPWASSGAGYGLNTHAIRYTSRTLDVMEGDLVLEVTYDRGNTDFRVNQPSFVELYAQYRQGDLIVDAVLQRTRNGTPQAWGQGPFTGLTPSASDDPLLRSSGQGIGMIMLRYALNSRIELLFGARRNSWSGANAVITQPGSPAQWNTMFNVDWNGSRDGIPNPGYSARSTDFSGGVRWTSGKWAAHTGFAFLGKASTGNPSERGQSNWLLINTAGLSYEVAKGLQVYGLAGVANFGRKGLAPLSMPANNAFTFVDPRVARSGNWVGAGVVYVF